MKKNEVGQIKNIKLDEESQKLELTIVITDSKFQRRILRDLSLSGDLTFEKDKLIFLPKEGSNA